MQTRALLGMLAIAAPSTTGLAVYGLWRVTSSKCPAECAAADPRWQAPGAFLIVKDAKHLFMIWEGCTLSSRAAEAPLGALAATSGVRQPQPMRVA